MSLRSELKDDRHQKLANSDFKPQQRLGGALSRLDEAIERHNFSSAIKVVGREILKVIYLLLFLNFT
jgi:hypothetical protein